MKNTTSIVTIYTICAAFALSGCIEGEPESEGLLDDEGDEETGEVSQALGEIECASSFNTDRVTQNIAWNIGTTYSYTTADGTYGSDVDSGEDCNSAMNVHFEGYPTDDVAMTVEYSVAWGDTMPSNQTDCERAHLSIGAYYFDESNGDVFRLVSTRVVDGEWSGSSCSFPSTQITKSFVCGGIPMDCQGQPVVSARAYYSNSFAPPTHKRVTARIKRTS
ncbi:MAG: hypothetical protein HOW73_19765 [Polyangiaceae bacterium]|nr:hypothetical protein [Polyangiaceae bacterium]